MTPRDPDQGDLLKICKSLNEHGAKYLVIGGMAMVLHGFNRGTEDIDLLVNKATSNICSNQGLNMLAFTIHLSLLGENGFKKLAKLNHYKASLLYNQLQEIPNIKLINNSFFNEFVFQLTNISSKDFLNKMLDKNIFAGIAIDEDKILVAVTESISNDEIHTYIKHLKEITC